ncbi:hypothetical protein MML48_9g00004442 [Holotrichia oblita]|uniref:Uncharacterized protein n=1 Tax=Holotrichia oblita TaxID=644536 RepID=A0ACB9SK73_HOLOL|nr:hypothetical protein MML48_9g00004442 [Holotrichia oblita]
MSKSKRLIMVHAGGKAGFVPNALLTFTSGAKSGDYHQDMNHENFMKWVKKQLLPNLPPKNVLVVDNASYHNVQIEKNPTSNTKKCFEFTVNTGESDDEYGTYEKLLSDEQNFSAQTLSDEEV